LATRFLGFLAVITPTGTASADRLFDAAAPAFALGAIPPTPTDIPPRSGPPVMSPTSGFRMSSDLDGLYVWLGPTGDATRADASWDTAFGGELAITHIHEAATLAAIGGSFGITKFTAHDGGRLWLDAVAGTRALGHTMVGLTAGPVMEVSDIEHPRLGASVGAWAFVGVTPYVRAGVVDENGRFIEIGLHAVLPVFRH
jgi:hypothetical protein